MPIGPHHRATHRSNFEPASAVTIGRPDDFHLHLRDGAGLASVVLFTARQFARALVMPNLKPPVTSVAMAAGYRERILQALPADATFEPLMTLYLTDRTAVDEVGRVAESGFVSAFKYYPAGATTNSDSGVTCSRTSIRCWKPCSGTAWCCAFTVK